MAGNHTRCLLCYLYRVFFNTFYQSSVPKSKTNCCQKESLFQDIFNVKKLLVGWVIFFVFCHWQWGGTVWKPALAHFKTWLVDFQTWLNHFKAWLNDFKTWLNDFKTWLNDFKTWLNDFKTWLNDFKTWLNDFKTWLNDFKTWLNHLTALSGCYKGTLRKLEGLQVIF